MSLAAWLVHDEEVQLRFPDGVFWITMGADADVAAKRRELQAALAAAAPEVLRLELEEVQQGKRRQLSVEQAAVQAALRRLIVLDDVWTEAHVQSFEDLAVGATTLLLTTRELL